MGISPVREKDRVEKYPDVAQQQTDADVKQPHLRIAGAGADPGLPPLPITGLDAKTLAIPLPQFTRRATHSPGRVDQFFLATLFRAMVMVSLVGHTNRKRNLRSLRLHRMPIPAGTLLSKRTQSFGRSPGLGFSATHHHRHQKG